MNRDEIKTRLEKGIERYEKGEIKNPNSRIEVLGWRYAKRMEVEYNDLVEGLYEVYNEKRNL